MAAKCSRSIVLSIALVSALAACGEALVEGDGEMTTETRRVEEFDSLRVSNGARTVLTVDPGATGAVDLAATTDSNLLEYLKTDVTDGTLRVSVESGGEVTSTRGFEVAGTVATLREVKASDGGVAVLTAAVAAIKLTADNGGRIDGESLEADDVEVAAGNGALITVCARGVVTGTVTNGGALRVLCGGDVSGVEASNGGTISSP